MALYLRRIRATEETEVPDHFEGVPLKVPVLLFGWAGGLMLTVAGICGMVLAAGTLLEAVGALCAAGGAIALAGVLRCRRYETQIGRQWVVIGAGPLTRRFKRDLVAEYRGRRATGWRKLYADHEVVIILTISSGEHILPTRDVDELLTSIGSSD